MLGIHEQLVSIIVSIMIAVSSPVNAPTITPVTPIMNIKIEKIGINNSIYDKGTKENDIDKNVIILEDSDYPDKLYGTVLIGAHSGTGSKAYFKNLNKLAVGDTITLTYNNKTYNYKINKISKDDKDGKIRIDYGTKANRLILYTCYPGDKKSYLVISSTRWKLTVKPYVKSMHLKRKTIYIIQ